MTPKSQEYPFTLGVASGDPLPDGVVLWTRLAPRPLMGGGMPANPVDVQWEVSEDQSFHRIVKEAPAPHNMQLYRGFSYGNLVEFSILDTRQFRTNFACGAQNFAEQCDERLDPSRTILGDEQEAWLLGNLKRSSARWNILPQQIRMAQVDRKSGAGTAYSMDKWDGYVGSRNRLFEVVKNSDVSNFVVLTGDSHKNWVNDLKEDFDNPNSPVLGTEFMGTSICSSGNGFEIDPFGEKVVKENPHIRYYNAERGYVRCKVTPKEMRADFRVIPYVTKRLLKHELHL